MSLVSAGSVGAWAIWKELPLLWSSLIVVSQIITVLKPYFPFYKYVRELSTKALALQNSLIEIERLWSHIERNKVDEDTAEETYDSLQKRINELLQIEDLTIFDGIAEDIRLTEIQTKEYLKNHYGAKN